uniref:Uncharacterized protein n=1 Tax=Arundo donax TaxID=35708 RepID=A0A0A9CKP4_ARUDO
MSLGSAPSTSMVLPSSSLLLIKRIFSSCVRFLNQSTLSPICPSKLRELSKGGEETESSHSSVPKHLTLGLDVHPIPLILWFHL